HGRRSDAGAHGRDRRARAAVRRRHLHADRLRVAGRRRQSRCRALLRRRRGLLAEALRDLGTAGSAAAGTDRLFDHTCESGRPSPNLFVAGEMMAGNVLGKGYTAGVGMSIGTAFGRIAGAQAAAAAAKTIEAATKEAAHA